MKRFYIYIFLMVIISCKKKKYKYEYYQSGEIKEKIEVNEYNVPDGEYSLFYENGKTKYKTRAKLGKFNDTLIIFYRNEKIKEKGKLTEGKRIGWWAYYDSLGYRAKQIEYIIKNDTAIENQKIYYKNGKIDLDRSYYFEANIPDTLIIGENIVKLINHSCYKREPKTKLLKAILNVNFQDKTHIDTVSSHNDTILFRIYPDTIGKLIINIELIETLLYEKEINKDSVELNFIDNTSYLNKETTVLDSLERH